MAGEIGAAATAGAAVAAVGAWKGVALTERKLSIKRLETGAVARAGAGAGAASGRGEGGAETGVAVSGAGVGEGGVGVEIGVATGVGLGAVGVGVGAGVATTGAAVAFGGSLKLNPAEPKVKPGEGVEGKLATRGGGVADKFAGFIPGTGVGVKFGEATGGAGGVKPLPTEGAEEGMAVSLMTTN
jgi:hypothetical protein